MKYIIGLLLVLVCTQVQSQSIGRFRYDSTIIEKVGGTNELVIRNKTKDTLGFLYNNGGGVTSFKRVFQLNDTTFVMGRDTVLIKSSASGGSGLNTLNGLNAGLQTLAIGTSGTAPNWVSATSTHTLNIPSALSVGVLNGTVPYSRTQIWDAKIGPSDTAAMLANYLNSGDTVSLSNRINQIRASGITALIADVVTSAPDPQGVAIAQLSNTGVVAGTYTNPTITVDSKGRTLVIANGSGGGGSGTDNVNGGAGYRWVISGQVIRTAFAGNGILIDSTTSTNGLTFKVDTSVIATLNDVAAVAAANTGITALTGDVTATGPGSSVSTVANDAITFAKFQNITSSRLLGRYTVGSGDMQEISLGSGLAITGGVLDVVGGGTSYSFTAPLSETGGVVSIANSLADGSTKGAASFTAADFNSSAGSISLDYTNGQAASAGTKGFLTSTDWATFNNKISNITGLITAGTNTTITGSGTAGSPYVINANSSGTVNTGFANTLAYYAVTGTVVDDLPAITASRALVSNASGLPVASATTSTELGYVSGVTSAIQTQLNAKQATIGLGSTSQYFRGDLSLATFPTNVSTFTNDAAYLTNVTGKITAGTNISITGSGTTGTPYVINSTATGLSDGDKGDITVSSTGTVWNIDALAVTNAEINDVAWGKITGVPTDIVYTGATQTLTNKTLTSPVINVTADATGDVYYRSAGGLFTRLGIGSDGQVLKVVSGLPAWAVDATSGGGGATLSDGDYGDVTVSGTGTAITVDAGAISNSKLANVATNIFKGRITAGTGAVEDLTVTQATSMLNTFTSTLKGLAPASGGGTTTFLRADGTWAAPASGYSFEPNDFDGTTTISIDYTNGQKASTTLPGFLTAANWNTFNNKQNAITTGTTAQYFRGDLSLATFPTAVSAFTNDAGYLTNITGKVTAGTAISITGLGTTASPYVINGTAGTTYSAGYGLTLASNTFSVDTATILAQHLTAINARVKYSDTAAMLLPYANKINTKLGNITGYITAGANITITGSGTAVSPYSIAAAGTSGVADGDKGDITVTSSGTVWNIDAGAVGNTEIAGGVDAAKIADGSVSSTEYQFINSLTSNAQTQLNGKQATITTGTTAQYFRGDLSLATFPTALSSFTNDPGFITNITGKLNAGTNVTVTGAGTTASPYVISATGGGATLSGTANRITIASDVVDIASTYVGQPSITTLGTVGTGIWQGTPIATTYGGVPAGGTVGQILAKINGTNYNTQWIPAPTLNIFGGYGISIDGENNISIDTSSLSAKYVLRGAVTAGSNITITGSGTGASPYVIASTGGGISDGDKGDITVASTGTSFTIDNLAVTNAKIASGVDAVKLADGTVNNTELQYINSLTSNAQTQIDRKQRVFNVLDYGGTRDGVSRINGAITSGDATLTSSGASFTSGDIGKIIKVGRAGTSGQDLVTTIASINSSTSVELSVNASVTVTNTEFDYGTDQTTAIQNAINAAFAAGGGTVLIPTGIYIINGALQNSVDGTNPNSQIAVPYLFNDQPTRAHVLVKGETPPQMSPSSWAVDVGPGHTGTTLVSTRRGSGTAPGVFGSAGPVPFDESSFNYNYMSFRDMQILVLSDPGTGGPTMSGISMAYGGPIGVENVVVCIDGSIYNSGRPTNESAGIIANTRSGEATSYVRNSLTIGFKYGMIGGDHTVYDHVQIYASEHGFVATKNFQAIYAGRVNVHWCRDAFYVPNGSVMGIAVDSSWFNVEMLNVEQWQSGSQWWNYQTTINDPGNRGHGNITYLISKALTGGIHFELFTKVGGSNIVTTPLGSSAAAGLGAVTAINAQTMDNIGIGTAPAGVYGMEIIRNNSDGGTNVPGMIMKNSNSTAASGSSYNFALTTMVAGNNAVIGQFATNYGIGATAPFDAGSSFMLGTRTAHPVKIFTNSAVQFSLNEFGVLTLPAYGGAGSGVLAVNNSGVVSFSAGGGGGSQDLEDVLLVGNNTGAGNGIRFGSGGTNKDLTMFNAEGLTDNLGIAVIRPSSGTNVSSFFQVVPLGTGLAGASRAAMDIWNTDRVLDGGNSELFRLSADGTSYSLSSIGAGSGAARPINLKIAGTNILGVSSSGTTLSGLTTGGSGDSVLVVSSGLIKMVAQSSISGGGGGTPAGANTQIQYNNSGAFGANGDFTWNNSTKRLVITNAGSAALLNGITISNAASGQGSRIQLENDGGALLYITAFGSTIGSGLNNVSALSAIHDLQFNAGGNAGLAISQTGGAVTVSGAYTLPTAAPGTNGYVMSFNTDGAFAGWVAASGGGGGGVSTVSGGTTGLTFSGTTSLTMSGTLIGANGGTGQSTYAVGDLLVGGSSNTLNKLTAGTSGYYLGANGAGVAPSWKALPGSGQDANYAVFSVVTAGTTGQNLGDMAVSSGESGWLEITVYAINSSSNSSYGHVVKVPYLATSATTISFGTEVQIVVPDVIGSALAAWDGVDVWDYGVNATTGDLTFNVSGMTGQNIQWRIEVRKHTVTWSS